MPQIHFPFFIVNLLPSSLILCTVHFFQICRAGRIINAHIFLVSVFFFTFIYLHFQVPGLIKARIQNKIVKEDLNDDTLLSKPLNSVARGKQRHANKYMETNDQLDMDSQLLTNREAKSVKSDRKDERGKILTNRRISDITNTSPEGGDLLFDNNENNVGPQEKDKSGYNNNDPVEPSEQERCFKHYYNNMQAEHRGNMPDKSYENQYNANRDRREIDSKSKDGDNAIIETNAANENEQLLSPSTENEEAAIKRHVKKLSSKELEELLALLSDDKRELLKKIISDDVDVTVDNINKREIIKKAGAAASDDNNFLEGIQVEVSKLQEGSSSEDGIGYSQQSTESTQYSKKTETTGVTESVTKYSSSSNNFMTADNKVELREHVDDLKQDKSKSDATLVESNKDKVNIDDQSSVKTEIKRDAKLGDLSDNNISFNEDKLLDNNFEDQELSNEEGYNMCPQDDEFSEIIDDDSQLHNTNGNSLKREAVDLSESMKSLEESFPNSNVYDDTDLYSGTMLAPLVRVKRRNTELAMKKRAAALSPEANVAYFPYRAENDDEDNDEGNEFDDDGFFDRTSNLAKSNLKAKVQEESPVDIGSSKRLKPNSKYSKSNNVIHSKNTMSLGSDTDGVISGVEGVDDNLMYNSASRNKRSEEESKANEHVDDTEPKFNRLIRSTLLMDDEIQTASEHLVAAAVANYQENDAFGSLPSNYEGELTRYKRIRRVKQPPNQDASFDV